jgi:hypothetical protein
LDLDNTTDPSLPLPSVLYPDGSVRWYYEPPPPHVARDRAVVSMER